MTTRTKTETCTNGNGRPHPPAAASPGAEQLLSIDQIGYSPTNPRKTIDLTTLGELAESIRTKGVLQPILVRRVEVKTTVKKKLTKSITIEEVTGTTQAYELVAGERRLRAAKMVGLHTIPASVGDWSDRDVLEIQVIENEQREDVSPLEKADGYAALVEQHGVTVEQLAERVGKSTSTIRGLLRLRQLPDVARKALLAGHIPAATAELIARVPGAKARDEAARYVLCGEDYVHGEPPDDEQIAREQTYDSYRTLSYRETKELIARHYQRELKTAPFSRKSLELVPEAGNCEQCSKRAGNDPEMVAEGVRADVCTDPECYERKCQAHSERLLAAAVESGQTVLQGKEAERLWDYSGARLQDSRYIDLAGDYWHDGKRKPFTKLLGKRVKEVEADVVVALDRNGQAHRLIPAEKAAPILKEAHGINLHVPGNASSGQAQSSYDREAAKRRAAAKAGKAAALKANATVADLATQSLAIVDGRLSGTLAMRLRALLTGLVSVVWSDSCRRVASRRELVGDDHRQAVLALANQLDDPGALLGLAAELVAAKLSLDWSSEWYGGERGSEKPFWAAWGIDRKKLVKEAQTEKKSAKSGKDKKAKAKPPANGHTASAPTDPPGVQVSAPPVQASADLVDAPKKGKPSLKKAAQSAADNAGPVEIGARVRRRQGNDRPGWVTGAKKVPSASLDDRFGEKVIEAYVKWDLLPGEKKKGAGWHLVDDLVVVARAGSEEAARMRAESSLPGSATDVAARAAGQQTAEPAGQCRVCGCTEADATICVERTGEPCTWTSPAKDLCSACLPILNAELGQVPGIPASTLKILATLKVRHVCQAVQPMGRGGYTVADPLLHAGLTAEQRRNLLTVVTGWIADQLRHTDDGTEMMPDDRVSAADACCRCTRLGGAVVDDPALADRDDDLVPLDLLDMAIVDALGLLVEQCEGAMLCGKCLDQLTREVGGVEEEPKAAKKRTRKGG